MHSLLLSSDGSVYVFGDKSSYYITPNNYLKPTKIGDEKFIDIASHWSENISFALSFDNIYHIWGECKDNLIPIERKCKSFNELIANHFEYNSEMGVENIVFKVKSYSNGFYKSNFIKLNKIGEGSYGTVFKVKAINNEDYLYAIKKIPF